MRGGESSTNTPAADGWFTKTHWTVVLAARDGDTTAAARALEKLCQTYWPPLYAFLRREGHSDADAKDLTQAFFAHLQAHEFLTHLKDRRGKFRSFLLTFLKNFLADERDRTAALKRGGDKTFISLEAFTEEDGQTLASFATLAPDQAFERRWAETVLAGALQRLREEYVAAGKESLFERLKDLQPGEHGDDTYAEVGRQLGLSESAIKSAVHRLRRRHREMLRAEIAQTVERAEEIDEEIQHLLRVMSA